MIGEHGEALEADLIRCGLRLRDCPSESFDWRDLLVLVRHSGSETALYKSMYPEQAGWTLTNMLLAAIVDVLRWLQWAKTKDGARGYNMPEPIPRPGVKGSRRDVHPRSAGLPRSRVRQLLGLKPRS